MAKIESGYSVESLENGIKAAKKNIVTFEEAIERERTTIKEYRSMMEILEAKSKIPKEIHVDMSSGKIIEIHQEVKDGD